MAIRLVIDSDLHFRNGSIRPDKSHHETLIKKLAESEKLDAVICAGDLTEKGYDGKKFMCWQYGGPDDQVTPLRNFVDALQPVVPVYLCEGNHDQYVPWPYLHKGVRDLVHQRHGDSIYSWKMLKEGHQYHFICLGVYPDKKARKFLAAELKANPGAKFVIYFHYNVEGAWSDWWTSEEKKMFLDIIEPYRIDIRLIIVGHRHSNYLINWKGYNVVSGASTRLVVCTVSPDSVTMREY